MADIQAVFERSHPLWGWYTGYAFVIGACIGSFLNVVIWRVPRGESIVRVPSHCPKCDTPIHWYENIPLISWLALRGRCRHCHNPISVRYPLIEGLTGVLFLMIWLEGTDPAGPLPPAMIFSYFALAAILVAYAAIDLDSMLVPLGITVTGLILALLFAGVFPASHDIATPPGRLEYLQHKPALVSFVRLLYPLWRGIVDHPRVLAVVDALLGTFLGGGFFWLAAKVGKILFGKREVELDEPAAMDLDADGFTIRDDEDEDHVEWEDLLIYDDDALVVRGTVEAFATRGSAAAPELPTGDLTITVDEENVTFAAADGEPVVVPLEKLRELRLRTREWVEPREAMGLGDAHIMAVIGAFLGLGACILVISVSTILGAVIGVALKLIRRGEFHRPIPFGPYLAAGGVIYMLWAPELIILYLTAATYIHNHVLN